MGKLFLHMGVFAAFSLLVLAVCFWMVRIEDRKQARRRGGRNV